MRLPSKQVNTTLTASLRSYCCPHCSPRCHRGLQCGQQ